MTIIVSIRPNIAKNQGITVFSHKGITYLSSIYLYFELSIIPVKMTKIIAKNKPKIIG